MLDEGVPQKLIPALRENGCTVDPLPQEWRGLRNGTLLDRIERAGFDCLITCDKNLEWQQNLSRRRVAILVLPFQKLALLLPITGAIAAAVRSTPTGKVARVQLDQPRRR